MNNNKPIELKSAIIGKAWKNQKEQTIIPSSFTLPSDMSFSANQSFLVGSLTVRTNRHLNASPTAEEVTPLELAAGTTLYFFTNGKREGHNDPDYSVSVRLPIAEAEAIIFNEREGAKNWRLENPVQA